jgi:hypothetical protein
MPLVALFVLNGDLVDGLTSGGGPKERTLAEVAVLSADDKVALLVGPLFDEGSGPTEVPPEQQANEGEDRYETENRAESLHLPLNLSRGNRQVPTISPLHH